MTGTIRIADDLHCAAGEHRLAGNYWSAARLYRLAADYALTDAGKAVLLEQAAEALCLALASRGPRRVH